MTYMTYKICRPTFNKKATPGSCFFVLTGKYHLAATAFLLLAQCSLLLALSLFETGHEA